jgi:protein SCO1/2
LLTFLYTHCPDVCPVTAINLNTALRLAGPAQKDVSVLAVSVDPEGDTPRSVAAFVRSHHLRAQFHYLTGSSAALRRIWSAYQVKAVRSGKDAGVDHTLYTLGIDRNGVACVLFDATAEPAVVAHDLRLLLS